MDRPAPGGALHRPGDPRFTALRWWTSLRLSNYPRKVCNARSTKVVTIELSLGRCRQGWSKTISAKHSIEEKQRSGWFGVYSFVDSLLLRRVNSSPPSRDLEKRDDVAAIRISRRVDLETE